jgi:tRNA-specific 2-thiouridylase
MKILLGMSGGVDSSVAAAMLRDEGHDVLGLSLVLFETHGTCARADLCCSAEAVESAAQTARALGIPHIVRYARDIFVSRVVEPFVAAYTAGRTPNPCILCNQYVKFPLLLEEARARGADRIATGHYARVERDAATGRPLLRKGLDPRKDQSYVLYPVGDGEMERLALPLGEMRKTDVRARARALGLPACDRPESQEICFVPGGSYGDFIEALGVSPAPPGPIVDTGGKVLGEHRGITHYTVGQRKGLGIPSPLPLFVTAIDAARNTIHVGRRDEALRREFLVSDIRLFHPLAEARTLGVRIRSTMAEQPATVTPEGEGWMRVRFEEPQWAPAPGQSAVFYRGDIVVGGGVIETIVS